MAPFIYVRDKMERLLTIKEICEIFQISRSTVYEWTHIGYVPHYKFSNGIRFRESELENWLKKRRRKGRSSYKIDFDPMTINTGFR